MANISKYFAKIVCSEGLHSYLNEVCEAEEKESFFEHALPCIVERALQLQVGVSSNHYTCLNSWVGVMCGGSTIAYSRGSRQNPCSQPTADRFVAGQCVLVYISTKEVSGSSSQLCLFLMSGTSTGKRGKLPSINFSELYMGPGTPVKAEKLRCIVRNISLRCCFLTPLPTT